MTHLVFAAYTERPTSSEQVTANFTIKVRQAGFGDCYDSQDRFVELFRQLAAAKVIPPLSL